MCWAKPPYHRIHQRVWRNLFHPVSLMSYQWLVPPLNTLGTYHVPTTQSGDLPCYMSTPLLRPANHELTTIYWQITCSVDSTVRRFPDLILALKRYEHKNAISLVKGQNGPSRPAVKLAPHGIKTVPRANEASLTGGGDHETQI